MTQLELLYAIELIGWTKSAMSRRALFKAFVPRTVKPVADAYLRSSKLTAKALTSPATTTMPRRDFIPTLGRAGILSYFMTPAWLRRGVSSAVNNPLTRAAVQTGKRVLEKGV